MFVLQDAFSRVSENLRKQSEDKSLRDQRSGWYHTQSSSPAPLKLLRVELRASCRQREGKYFLTSSPNKYFPEEEVVLRNLRSTHSSAGLQT